MDSTNVFRYEYEVTRSRRNRHDGTDTVEFVTSTTKGNVASQQLQSHPEQKSGPPGVAPNWALVPAYAARSESQGPEPQAPAISQSGLQSLKTPAARRGPSSAAASANSGIHHRRGGEKLQMVSYGNMHWKAIDESTASSETVRPTSLVLLLGLFIFFLAIGSAIVAILLMRPASSGDAAGNDDKDTGGKVELHLETRSEKPKDIFPADFPRRTKRGEPVTTELKPPPTLPPSLPPTPPPTLPPLPPERPIPDVVEPAPYTQLPELEPNRSQGLTTEALPSKGSPSEEVGRSTEEEPSDKRENTRLPELEPNRSQGLTTALPSEGSPSEEVGRSTEEVPSDKRENTRLPELEPNRSQGLTTASEEYDPFMEEEPSDKPEN